MANQKILIVDDSKVIRMQVQDMLPKGNFEILEAKDGVEGLEIIQESHPHLILLDFFMPRMNGWEVVQKLQADPVFVSIPVVMMSGRKEDVLATVPELFNYFEFLSKPFDPNTLLRAIKSAMAKAKTRSVPMVATAAVHAVSGAKIAHAAPAGPASTVSTAPGSTSESAEFQHLKAEITKLQQHNALLQRDLDMVKKQLAQVIAFVKQKLS